MDSSEVKARGHRRFQRLKARFSPTAIYWPTDTPGVAGSQPTDSSPAANDSPATSAPTPTPASQSTPATSATPAQPGTSSAAAAAGASTSAAQPPANSSTPSTSSPTDSASTPSTSGPATSSTPATSAATSAASNAASNTPSPSSTPKQTKDSGGQQSAASDPAAVIPGNTLTGSGVTRQTATNTVIGLPASGSATPTQTGTTEPSSGVNAGLVVGVVVAVIGGIALVIFAVTFFVRRARKNNDEDAFNPDEFKRQSMAIVDPEPSRMVPDRGYTPRPPSMIQQRMAQGAPVSYGQHPYGNSGYYGYPDQPSFSPGQVVAMPGQPMPPQAWAPTPNSSAPFFSPMGDSPMGSPVSVAPYDSAYDMHGNLIRQPSPGPMEALNRQPSMGAASQLSRQPSAGPNAFLTRQSEYANMALGAPDANAHYVDLARSSVSPYQAEQYAEISHQLSSAPPAPMPSPLAAMAAEEVITKEEEVVTTAPEPRPLNVQTRSPHGSMVGSPFADPQMQMQMHADDMDMPKPPSPTFSNKSRVDSMPPTLPEMQRAFSPVSIEFPMNAAGLTRAAPSPLAASVQMPTSPVEAHINNAAVNATHHDSAPPTPRPMKGTMPAARPDTVYTVYDDDDAYGGI